MLNIILDTNILFSALAFDKHVEDLVRKVLDDYKNFTVWRSDETLIELQQKLTSKKFLDYRKFDLNQVQELLDWYKLNTRLAEVSEKVTISRDPGDNKFLELAKAIDADYIISGDKDLLEIGEFEGVKILKPSVFLQEIGI
jgi:putative PIN family toxin of toxin-antitoxin system